MLFNLDAIPEYLDAVVNGCQSSFNKKTFPSGFAVISYKKDKLKESPSISAIRSVIIDDITKEVVCFSPPKSTRLYKIDEFGVESQVEEFVEGTMINLFWSKRHQNWEIATKNNVGANCSFFSKKTFREMFFEAVEVLKIDLENDFYINHCYSFVLQHPENRIVTDFKEIKLYLIDIFEIIDPTTVKAYSHPLHTAFGKVALPHILNRVDIRSHFRRSDHTCMGVIIREEDGKVFKIRNHKYEKIRALRGNHPNLLYCYYELRKTKRLKKFLVYFPEHSQQFNLFLAHHNGLISYLYNLYCNTWSDTWKTGSFHSAIMKTLHMISKNNNPIIDRQLIYNHVSSLSINLQIRILKEYKAVAAIE
jgi:hypothetical protein